MDIKKLNEKLENILEKEQIYHVIAYKDDEIIKQIYSTKNNYKKDVEKLKKLNPDVINVFLDCSGQLSHIAEY